MKTPTFWTVRTLKNMFTKRLCVCVSPHTHFRKGKTDKTLRRPQSNDTSHLCVLVEIRRGCAVIGLECKRICTHKQATPAAVEACGVKQGDVSQFRLCVWRTGTGTVDVDSVLVRELLHPHCWDSDYRGFTHKAGLCFYSNICIYLWERESAHIWLM